MTPAPPRSASTAEGSGTASTLKLISSSLLLIVPEVGLPVPPKVYRRNSTATPNGPVNVPKVLSLKDQVELLAMVPVRMSVVNPQLGLHFRLRKEKRSVQFHGRESGGV